MKGIKNEGTKDYVLVRYLRSDGSEIHRKQINGLAVGGARNKLGLDGADLHSIEVHVEGDDSMMIDRPWLKREGSRGWNMHTKWGGNNRRGWCLSEDPLDIDTWRRKADQCAPGVKFVIGNGLSYAGDAEYLSKHDYEWTDQYCIDYSTKGVSGGDTYDPVVWKFMDKNGVVIKQTEFSIGDPHGNGPMEYWPIGCENCWHACYDVVTSVPIESFQVEIKGSDALMIDRVRKARWGKTNVDDHVQYWGANNDRGWCLSTDPSDGDGSWSGHADGCHACIKFRDDGSAISC